jgi:hypothetical protein
MNPTPTTSPLIEGIIEEFDLKYFNSLEVSKNANEHRWHLKQFLLTSLQKVEQSTVERCLKALPEEKDDTDMYGNQAYELFTGWNDCRKQSLSAIKKEFKRE